MTAAIAALTQAGATIVDPADLPSVRAPAGDNLDDWPVCNGLAGAKGRDADCSTVFKYGMKRDFNAWLASLGAAAPVKSLTELRAWNRAHEAEGTLKYGQAQLDISDEMDLDADRERYVRDRAKDVRLGGRDGIDAALRAHRLDALLFPGSVRRRGRGQAWLPHRHRPVRHRAQHRRRRRARLRARNPARSA